MSSALIAQLREKGAELSKRAMDEIYRRPFWVDRFGERGRRYADEDGNHHISYVVEALSGSEPAVMRSYARWLQPVLVTRGMCTRHLDENFDVLQRMLKEELQDATPAVEMLQAARQGLIYPDGFGRPVQLAAEALSRTAREKLPQADRLDVDDHLSYLADGAQMARTDLFVSYVKFMKATLDRRAAPVRERELLGAISQALESAPDVRAAVSKCLAAGMEALG